MTTEQVLTTEETPERRPHDEGGSHGPHPKDTDYIIVAIILAVATGIEVAMSYWHINYFTNGMLLVLAIFKFSCVVLFFMHLRVDNPVFRRVFLTGIILAIGVYTVVLLTLGVFVGGHK